jgi:hypothetical protein
VHLVEPAHCTPALSTIIRHLAALGNVRTHSRHRFIGHRAGTVFAFFKCQAHLFAKSHVAGFGLFHKLAFRK